MHILMTNGSLQGGGAERVIATLSRHLAARGHRVSIAALSSGGEVLDELQADGFEVLPSFSGHGLSGLLSTSTRLRDLVTEHSIDVVHTHDVRSLVEVGASRRLTRAFAHVHTFHFGNYPHLPAKHLWLERVLSRTPDRLVAVGHRQAETLSAALHLPHRRLSIIWNGVDAPALSAPPDPPRAVPLVGSVSAFFAQKGLPVLLEAAHRLRQQGLVFQLLLVGDGPLRGELEAMTTTLGLGNTVTFAGWHADAARTVLPTLDVFVQSSNWEAMSVVVLEAMAARCPIVATSVGDNARVLAHARTGWLVPPRNADALADGLAELLRNPSLRERLARAARADYDALFTAQGMAERYETMYATLLTRSARRSRNP